MVPSERVTGAPYGHVTSHQGHSVKLLHTSDWHVGKTIKGRSRISEHEAVLAEIVAVADREQPDITMIVGDMFDTSTPTPDAERVVYQTLLDLAQTGTQVIAIAGNHDNPRRWQSLVPLMNLANVHVAPTVIAPNKGGTIHVDTPAGPANVALVPFLSQRGIVKARDLFDTDRDERAAAYEDRLRDVIKALSKPFTPDAVNIVMAHLTVVGEDGVVFGGGERKAHTVFDYRVRPSVFPATANYVALGHLHAAQKLEGPTDIRYCGSPLHLDFSDRPDPKAVLLVDVEPGQDPTVTEVELTSSVPFVTVRGSLTECETAAAAIDGPAYVRVIVEEAPRPGLADEVRDAIPDAVDVRLHAPEVEPATVSATSLVEVDDPAELFSEYLTHRNVTDERVPAFFRSIVEEHATRSRDEDTEDAA